VKKEKEDDGDNGEVIEDTIKCMITFSRGIRLKRK
jgi:hypothetical protein